ncbi:hypothetical protein [Haloarchaeobius sp. HME9146]|uniref:hypothetical protein n=1 Tax=Haloarchaeobius sp. HME9146 TaxID=2978732 RepID=UPI0021C0F71D|nr:hypothetical protein [Haloarchaeobius sp. HME9146]MCT9094678.1 hypothetical protein [Haloarchaeobius sp. HME9146]
MREHARDAADDDLAGMPVADAAEVVLDRDQSRDRDEVERTLQIVADDGVVTREAVDDALGRVSKVVATPETRVELAARDLAEARETASHVADLDTVQARLDEFEARLSAVEDRTAELGEELQTTVGQQSATGDIYEIASEVRRITSLANNAQQVADDLKLDIEDFEKWVGSQSVRFRQLDEEVEAAGERLDELAAALDREWSDDDAGDWVDMQFQRRVLDLVLADLWASLAEFRTWADREDLDRDDRDPGVAATLDDLDDQLASFDQRLDEVARSAWRDRFGEVLDSLEAACDHLEPPIPWGEVEQVLDEHRSMVEDTN